MSLVDDWRERHPRTTSRGRVVIYVFLLIMVFLFMLMADPIVRGFTGIFFPADTTSVQEQ